MLCYTEIINGKKIMFHSRKRYPFETTSHTAKAEQTPVLPSEEKDYYIVTKAVICPESITTCQRKGNFFHLSIERFNTIAGRDHIIWSEEEMARKELRRTSTLHAFYHVRLSDTELRQTPKGELRLKANAAIPLSKLITVEYFHGKKIENPNADRTLPTATYSPN